MWSSVKKKNTRPSHSVGGWLQCLDSDCDDERVSSKEYRGNNKDGLGDFWLFPYVWEDGCDNCYLGGEQRKQLHREKAGHPRAGRTQKPVDKHICGCTHTLQTRQPFMLYTKPFTGLIFTLFVLFSLLNSCRSLKNTFVAFSPQNDVKENRVW